MTRIFGLCSGVPLWPQTTEIFVASLLELGEVSPPRPCRFKTLHHFKCALYA